MEWIIAAGAIAAIFYAAHHTAQGSPPGSTAPPGSSSPPGSTTPPGSPPAPVPVLAPGVYPPNTPGAYPVSIGVIGGDGFGQVTASPGGRTQEQETIWYAPGTSVVFTQQVIGGFAAFGTAFDHWTGTGGETRQPVVATKISGAGYINAVFATFGIVGA